jgi:hypothetical protein
LAPVRSPVVVFVRSRSTRLFLDPIPLIADGLGDVGIVDDVSRIRRYSIIAEHSVQRADTIGNLRMHSLSDAGVRERTF